jgi:hypothetical protein
MRSLAFLGLGPAFLGKDLDLARGYVFLHIG